MVFIFFSGILTAFSTIFYKYMFITFKVTLKMATKNFFENKSK